jgi:hypothetical protein
VKARLFSLGGERHRAVEQLLPWYANGTLDQAERAEVEAHVRECARCQGDVRWQQRLQAAEPLPEVDAKSDARSDAEADRGWARLRAALDEPRSAARPRAPHRFAWAFVAAPLAFVGVIAAVLVVQEGAPYRGLAASSPSAANALVVFSPGTTEAQIRALLRAQHAQVVSGPTSTDAWLVQVPHARLEAAIAAWRTQSAVARAESLEAVAPAPAEGTR